MREVVATALLVPPYDALTAGALAFLEGRADDARRHFASVEDSAMGATIRGSVMLARATLAVADDPSAASLFLDRARLSAPGTLVEEAALRRAILIATEKDDLPAFEQMVSRYVRKFRTSVYAGNFRRQLVAGITRMTFIRDAGAFARLEALFEPMTVDGRQELYLLLARAAIENGNPLAAQVAAKRVQDTAQADTLDHRRARLYQAASEVVDAERYVGAVATLEALEAEALPPEDRALLKAALDLSRTVIDLPQAARDEPSPLAFAAHGQAAPVDAITDEPTTIETTSDGGARAVAPALAAPGFADVTPSPDAVAAEDGPFAPPVAVEQRVAAVLSEIDSLLENDR